MQTSILLKTSGTNHFCYTCDNIVTDRNTIVVDTTIGKIKL